MTSQPQVKFAWVLGSTLLALAVLIGAFGAHGLKSMVTPEKLITFETGVRYHFYHAFGILLTAIFGQLNPTLRINTIVNAFMVGILIFSFNCYVYVLTDIKAFAMMVPLGGVLFVCGWLLLGRTALKVR